MWNIAVGFIFEPSNISYKDIGDTLKEKPPGIQTIAKN